MSGVRLVCAIVLSTGVLGGAGCGGDDDPLPAIDAAREADAEPEPDGAPPDPPERLLALTTDPILLVFDADAPEAAVAFQVTGIDGNHALRGIDRRPANGQIYLLAFAGGAPGPAVPIFYVINPDTAQATQLLPLSGSFAGLGDLPSGFDFIPGFDLIRIVNANDENARCEPGGASLADDPNVTPAGVALIGLADDGTEPMVSSPNVYGIDRAASALVRLGGPDGVPSTNSGITTAIGPLGFTLTPTEDAGFDISPAGVAFAAMADDSDDLARLYTIDTATGTATTIGLIGDGSHEIVGLTALP